MSMEAVNNLGKTDFLNLLATQLRYQDPLNPTDNTEFVAQLAQFSALESAQNTQENIAALSGQTAKTRALDLLGKTVSGVRSSDLQLFAGAVTAVDVSADSPQLSVNGLKIPLEDIQFVTE